jgi:O-antigen/teichoic acid export membrane protein
MTAAPSRAREALWRFVRGAAVVAVGMAVMNLGSYGLTVLAAHVVTPADFGAMTALLGLIQIGFVVSYGIQALAARRVATATASTTDDAVLADDLLRAGRTAAWGLTLLAVLATPLLMAVLHVSNPVPVLLVAPTLGMLTAMGGQAGVLQGRRRWRDLALVYAALGVGRLAFGALGLLVSADLLGAMAGIAVGSAAPVLLGRLLLRRHGAGSSAAARDLLRESVRGTHALLALYALANADVLIARSLMDGHDSGLYAVGSVVAKACMLLPQFVTVVAFPSLAARPADGRRLAAAAGLTGGIGVVAVLGSWLLADPAVAVIGGSDYASVAPSLWLFAVAGSAYAVLQLLVYAAIALHARWSAPLLWLGLAALVVASLTLRDTLTVPTLVTLTLTCAAAVSVLMTIGLRRASRPKT